MKESCQAFGLRKIIKYFKKLSERTEEIKKRLLL
jgi:hypothetical protein